MTSLTKKQHPQPQIFFSFFLHYSHNFFFFLFALGLKPQNFFSFFLHWDCSLMQFGSNKALNMAKYEQFAPTPG